MKQQKPKCPDCGADAAREYEPAYQEYAGASVQGGYYHITCDSCGYCEIEERDLSDYNFQENKRGW